MGSLKYISLFSGIEAASVAWQTLGWEPVAFAEIEPFPSSVLAHRFPDVPNLGDVTEVDWSPYRGSVDVVVGGSPCQSFSIAGKRGGLGDFRGRLMLEYVRAIRDIGPRWVVWENVPGVLSQDGGRAFATLLRELAECGLSLAWRVLDAQFFGVAQRRRRVFLIGGPTAGSAPAILFEPGSMPGGAGESRAKRDALARADGKRSSGQGHVSAYAVRMREGKPGGGKGPLISEDVSLTLATGCDQIIFQRKSDGWDVRRLTPVECERLQGFPEGWTDIPGARDAQRYKALGNSMAVPVMRWIGQRIQIVNDIYERGSKDAQS